MELLLAGAALAALMFAPKGAAPKLRVLDGGKSPPKPKTTTKTKTAVAKMKPAAAPRGLVVTRSPDGGTSLQPGPEFGGTDDAVYVPEPSRSVDNLNAAFDRQAEKNAADGAVAPSAAARKLAKAKPKPKPKIVAKPKLAAKPKPQPKPKPIPKPKKPPPPRIPVRPPPTAAKLAKPAKRTPSRAAVDLRDYLNAGGNPGSRAKRSDFVKLAQQDMGGVAADGVFGSATKQRAARLGVVIANH